MKGARLKIYMKNMNEERAKGEFELFTLIVGRVSKGRLSKT